MERKNYNRNIFIKEKLGIKKYPEINSIHKASEKFSIDQPNIRYCIKRKEELKNASNKNTKITVHKDKISETLDKESKILEFIDYIKKLDLPIKSLSIILELMKYRTII